MFLEVSGVLGLVLEDADMALETAELAKSQILQQAATAMVGQANQAMQTILSLLR